MNDNFKDILIREDRRLRDAIKVIDSNTYYNMAIVLDDSDRFVGVLTSGDVTRAMLSGASLDDSIAKHVNKNSIALHDSDVSDYAVRMRIVGDLVKRRGFFMPILDKDKKILNLIHYLDLQTDKSGREEDFSHKAILVVGGAGYLGSVLIKKLLERGYRVTCLDNFVHNNYAVCEFTKKYPNLKIIKNDLRNISYVVRSLEGINAVVHLAAVVGDPACSTSPTDAIEINFLATKMIAEAAKYSQVNRFIYASTCSVYGISDEMVDESSPLNPVSLYARSKVKSEEGILDMVDDHFSPTIMRMATLFGLSYRMRFDLVVNTLVMNALNEGRISIFGGNQWRPLLNVSDAADAYLAVLKLPKEKTKGQIYNIGSEKMNYQIRQIGDIVKKALPGTVVEMKDDLADARNYRVSFQKAQRELSFYTKKTIEDSVFEIRDFIINNRVDVKDTKYSNHALVYDEGIDISDHTLT